MKRLGLLMIVLLFGVFASARTLSREEAAAYACKFFDNTTSSSLRMVWSGQTSGTPAFYVFNNVNGGFVIISAEDSVTPVLGYSHTGSFRVDAMPSNIRGWFGAMEKDIIGVRSKALKANARIRDEWANIGLRTKGGDAVLYETAEWDQGHPYNYYCDLPGGKAVTGCVATAMSIFMRYMEYPEHGTGKVPSYRLADGTLMTGYSIEDHYYDWDEMPLKNTAVKKASTDVQNKIATIMHDCGMSVYMAYSKNGSGASPLSMARAFYSNFGYSASCVLAYRSNYETSEWNAMLKKELAKGQPVIYDGQDPTGQGGHQFIIDGYDENGLWHLNWGWSGSSNGYFTLDLHMSDYQPSLSQHALLGLDPDPDRTQRPSYNLSLSNAGLTVTSGELVEGKEFVIKPNYICNQGFADYSGNVVPALVDRSNNVIERLSQPQKLEIPAAQATGGYYIDNGLNFTCKLSRPMTFSDGIVLLYQIPGTEDYVMMPYEHDGTMGRLTVIPYFIVLDKSEYKVGDTLELKLAGGSKSLSNAVWYFDGVKTTDLFHTLKAGNHTIKVELSTDSGKETIVQEIVVK